MNVVVPLYRSLLCAARKVEMQFALRLLLTAPPTRLYNHSTSQWECLPVDQIPSRTGRRDFDEIVRDLNNGRCFLRPGAGETRKKISEIIRKTFRGSQFSNENLTTAFDAMRTLNGASQFEKLLSSAPPYELDAATAAEGGSLEIVPEGPDVFAPLSEGLTASNAHLLIAHPLMAGYFKHAVMLVTEVDQIGCTHEAIILNNPLMADRMPVPVSTLSSSSDHPLLTQHLSRNWVMMGGPITTVTTGRKVEFLFLHRIAGVEGSKQVAPGLFLGGTHDALAAKIEEKTAAPGDVMVLAGHSGWGKGQLAGELLEGTWFPCVLRQSDGGRGEQGGSLLWRGHELVTDYEQKTQQPLKMWSELMCLLGPEFRASTLLAAASNF